MEYINCDILLNLFFIKHSLYIKFFLMIIGIQLKGVLLNYFESVDQGIISENASIIDITDYHNLSLIITTENKIYTGVPPNIKCNTSSQIINISSAATYNEDNIFIACSKEYLLSNINLETR